MNEQTNEWMKFEGVVPYQIQDLTVAYWVVSAKNFLQNEVAEK